MSFVGTVRNGVVLLPRRLALPDGTEIRVETVAPAEEALNALADTFAVLAQRFASGGTDTAACHNEHQPWRDMKPVFLLARLIPELGRALGLPPRRRMVREPLSFQAS